MVHTNISTCIKCRRPPLDWEQNVAAKMYASEGALVIGSNSPFILTYFNYIRFPTELKCLELQKYVYKVCTTTHVYKVPISHLHNSFVFITLYTIHRLCPLFRLYVELFSLAKRYILYDLNEVK